MEIIEKQDLVGICPKCNSKFSYTENDLKKEFVTKYKLLGVFKRSYITCPVCGKKLLESEEREVY